MSQITITRHKQTVQHFVQDINGVPLEMILILGGTFMMGAPREETDSLNSERPQHSVNVPTFIMGRYPITQRQWRAVAQMPKVLRELKPNPSYFKGDKRPVEQVSWYDALEFCARLSRHTKRNYRLPSEAEWEYACRAGTTTPFHFGETISTDLANYNGSDENYGAYGRGIRGKFRRETTDVDYFRVANTFGLSEMHGNVREWCLDPWHENYEGAPEDGRVWDEQNKNENYYQDILQNLGELLKNDRSRVIRGGSWDSQPRNCRSACRVDTYLAYGNSHYSFRVVCVPPRTVLPSAL